MPITNYQNPGVYVTQASNPVYTSANNAALNICFIGNSTTVPSGYFTDRYLYTGTISGTTNTVQSGTFSQTAISGTVTVLYGNGVPMTLGSGIATGGTVTACSGGDYALVYSGGYATGWVLSSGSAVVISGGTRQWITAKYWYPTAVNNTIYTFADFNSVQSVFGSPFNFSGQTASVKSPVSLAAYLAFQNGAQVVSCVNISGTTNNTEQNYLNFITSTSGGLSVNPDIDVLVPLVPVTTTGVLMAGLASYLDYQSTVGIYQRAFVGLSQEVTNATLVSTVNSLVSSGTSTRMTLVAPSKLQVNPGLNSVTGLSNSTFNVDGYYLAAAVAGVFVGQDDVYVPITHKNIVGFTTIPNQISSNDSTTLQSLGCTVVRQKPDGTIYIRQGLTTNTSNWMTQEISINAIGDRLSQNIQNALESSFIIGSPLTQNTLSSMHSIILATLMAGVDTNLIQSFQNLSYQLDIANPTTVNVTFQYSPTLPLNYVQVTMSVNSQSGLITTASNISSSAIA